MNKKSILLGISVILASTGFAAGLTPAQALERASSSAEGKRLIGIKAQPQLAFTYEDKSGDAAVYVFNQPQNGGMMFLSADDIAMPVLGYTDSGCFDSSDVPPVVAYWLGEYAREIEYAKRSGRAVSSARQAYPSSWTYVHPRLTTQWNQDAPYNRLTPELGNSHAPTGCVATAMAQVMNYWKYPETGQGSIAYYLGSQMLTMQFDREKFQWDEMLNRYVNGNYTEEQAYAVSYLMKACGYSTEMGYTRNGSGTPTGKAGIALVKYFNYDGNIKRALRCTHSDLEWATMVYDQVKNVGPVIYDGDSPDGGHAFVVDGYDGNGYFHVNWGWGGKCNGYYLLTALNPSEQGTGGSFGGFNSDQGMVYDIQKPTGKPAGELPSFLTMFGSVKASMSGNEITFKVYGWQDPGFANMSLGAVQFNFGIEIQNESGSEDPKYYVCVSPTAQVLQPGFLALASTTPVARIPNNLADGRYKVTLMYKKVTSTNNWEHFGVPIGNMDYVYVTKKGNDFTVENPSRMRINLEAATIATPLYYGNPCLINYTFSNSNDMELTQMVRPTLILDGKINYMGDTQLITIPANSKKTLSISTLFYKEGTGKVPSSTSPVDFTLGAYDYNYDYDYGTFGTYTMKRSGSNVKVALDELEITNALETEEQNGTPLFGIDNYHSINVSVGVSVSGTNAFLASPLTAVISEYNTNEDLLEKEFPNMIYLGTGESAKEKVSINFDDYDVSKIYSLSVYYLSGTTRISLGSVLFGASSGVENVTSTDDALRLVCEGNTIEASSANGIATLCIYSADGMKVAERNGNGETSVQVPSNILNGGIYIVKATDNRGNERTIKVRK